MPLRTLYICYFGLRQPLVQTQVLPYLRQLSRSGIKVHLLTFEPELSKNWNAEQINARQAQLDGEGIRWFHLPYHKSPSLPATLYDIFAGARFAVNLARRESIDVLHARAHVPMAMALLALRIRPFKLIFDIRGLMAEEYLDSGIWKEQSLPFRLVKRLERAGIERADQIVVLTERMRAWLISQQLKSPEQIQVIPCCVDFQRFAQTQSGPKNSDRFEIVYAGSLIGLYLVEEMGRFFKALKSLQPDAFLRILSVSPPEQGANALRRAGLDDKDFEILAVSPEHVPFHLSGARLGVSFRKATFAQIAASPTKIPEYLAAGLPVICNLGIGDMDELVANEGVGVVLYSFDADHYQEAAAQALKLSEDPQIPTRCRAVAETFFDLETVGGPKYVELYRRLEGEAQRQPPSLELMSGLSR
jgi:glycosyltransferase involved in cell wall biosynthesis